MIDRSKWAYSIPLVVLSIGLLKWPAKPRAASASERATKEEASMRTQPIVYAVVIALALAVASCSTFPKGRYESDPGLQAALVQPPEYPDVRLAVLSDLHYLDPALWGEGAAIEAYLREDRKLLRESAEILGEAMRLVATDPAQIVIVPGDLTKDGERSSHLQMARQLRGLESSGKQVFVVCGNHDVLNREAFRYEGDDHMQVAIRDRLLAEGSYHISSTEICGRRYLRLTIINPQTTEDTIEGLLTEIERIAG